MLRKWLASLTLLFVGVMIVNTGIALAYRWPAMFDAPGNPDTIGTDFILHGTMISPPVHAMVLLAVAAVFALRDGWRGVLATVLLVALSTLGIIAGGGEPQALPANRIPDFAWQILGAIGRYTPLAIVAIGLAELSRRAVRRSNRSLRRAAA